MKIPGGLPWWAFGAPIKEMIKTTIEAPIKGMMGEFAVKVGAALSLPSSVYRRYHDVTLPTVDGTTQIDHVFVSVFGVFVVETKNKGGVDFRERAEPGVDAGVSGRTEVQVPESPSTKPQTCQSAGGGVSGNRVAERSGCQRHGEMSRFRQDKMSHFLHVKRLQPGWLPRSSLALLLLHWGTEHPRLALGFEPVALALDIDGRRVV